MARNPIDLVVENVERTKNGRAKHNWNPEIGKDSDIAVMFIQKQSPNKSERIKELVQAAALLVMEIGQLQAVKGDLNKR